MKIDIIEPIGMCAGVKNSIDKIIETTIDHKGSSIFCLGAPVHNEAVTTNISKKGVKILDVGPEEYKNALTNLPDGCVIIFSAHGHDRKLDEICKSKNMTIVDTVCPIVKTIEEQIKSIIDSDENKSVLYLGKKNHAESYSAAKISDKVYFQDISSSNLVDIESESVVVYNQTTILKDNLNSIYDRILDKYTTANIRNTSCRHVNLRYEKLKKIYDGQYDYIVVVGSGTSSNTIELYNKACEIMTKEKVLLINKTSELKKYDFSQAYSVALVSGTSAPDDLIVDIYDALKAL